MTVNLPEGVTEKEIRSIIDHYENLTEEQRVAEVEAVMSEAEYIEMLVPKAIAAEVVNLIQSFEDQQDLRAKKKARRGA